MKKKSIAIGIISVSAMITIIGFQNMTYYGYSSYGSYSYSSYDKELEKQKALEKEGGITVVGDPGSGYNPTYDMPIGSFDLGDWWNENIFNVDQAALDPVSACQSAQNKVAEDIKNAMKSGAKVVLIGELHGTINSQYSSVLNQLFANGMSGTCLAMEASSRDMVSGTGAFSGYAGHSGWMSVIQTAEATGMSVSYVDGVLGGFMSGVMNSGASAEVQDATIAQLNSAITPVNQRDVGMAQSLRALYGQCSRIISFNGINHLKDSREGRTTLASQLGAEAAIVDLSGLEVCEPK